MRYWYLAATCVLLIQPLSSQVTPRHQTPTKNGAQTNQRKEDTQQATTPLSAGDKTINTQTPDNRAETHQRERSREFKWGLTKAELIMATLTAVYVGLTLAYVIVSGRTLRVLSRQGLSMRRQTTHMRRTAFYAKRSSDEARKSSEFTRQTIKDSERAEVLLASAKMDSNSGVTFDGWLELTIKNFGRTRATDVSGHFKFTEVPLLSDSQVNVLNITLGAGQEHVLTFKRFVSLINGQAWDAALRGERVIRFVGELAYGDIFGEKYATYCSGIFNSGSVDFTIEKNTTTRQ